MLAFDKSKTDNAGDGQSQTDGITPPQSELTATFDRMRQAARASNVVDLSLRKDRLKRLRTMISRNDDRIIAAIDADFGHRVADETRLLEIVPLMNAFCHTLRHLRSWMRPERRRISITFQPANGRVLPQPLGVVGIVAPWNYPLYLSIGPLIDALAAGNRAMIKPSEVGPRFSALLRDLIAETFSPDEVVVCPGDATIAQAFTALPFDHLFFTGSTEVGRHVARAAAQNLTPVTLELGGKSPAIVLPDADISRAARSIAFGKLANAGQTCVAPDHVWVPRSMLEPLTDALEQRIAQADPAFPARSTSIVATRHYDRLTSMLQDLPEGLEIHRIGQDAPEARKMAPRLVIDPPRDSRLMQEEIFGPILPILPYDDLDLVLDQINTGPRPLALYCFSRNRALADRVVSETIAGGMTVNGTLLHLAQDELPFGGVGASGIGAYHGHEGFKRFSHMKSVLRIGPLNIFERMGPPWGYLAKQTYRFLGR